MNNTANARHAVQLAGQQHDGHPNAVAPSSSVRDTTDEQDTTFDTTAYLVAAYGLTLTTSNVAEVLHCHPSHVRAMCGDGRLRAVRVGDRWRIPAVQLAALVEGRV